MERGNELQSEREDTALEAGTQTIQIQRLLDRLQAGDEAARTELINCACARLERLTRKMLGNWERVHRWEQTCDVLQNALMRLYRSLVEARPARPLDFFRLAALNIRRELQDLAKHYYGPRGVGANHATAAWSVARDADSNQPAYEAAEEGEDPANLAAWTEFHAQVGRLPDDERAVFDLLWYQELSQVEAAALLSISPRTLKRRWASARLRLHELLAGVLPDSQCNVLA
jgi:RNA polymerase sigma-70 factor (ECF subfamily)